MADPSVSYLGAAFGVAWVALAGYLVRLGLAQRKIDRRLDEPPPPDKGPRDLG